MSMNKQWTVALVGCGLWGRNILRDLLGLGARVIVVDSDESARAVASRQGCHGTYDSITRLPNVDGYVVATPASTHARVLDELLSFGRPVFTEKPFTTDPQSAARLARIAPDSLFVMHVWRYHPAIHMLAEVVKSRELGPLEMIRITRANWTSPRCDTDSIWTFLPHDLSILLEILGCIPEPRFAVAEKKGDRVVGVFAVLGDSPKVVIEASNRYADKRREVRIHCCEGVAVLGNLDAEFIEIARDKSGSLQPEIERRTFPSSPSPLQAELLAFLCHLQGGPPPSSSATEGLAVVQSLSRIRDLAEIAG